MLVDRQRFLNQSKSSINCDRKWCTNYEEKLAENVDKVEEIKKASFHAYK